MTKLRSKLIDIVLILAVLCPASFLTLVIVFSPRDGEHALLKRTSLIKSDTATWIAVPLFELYLLIDQIYFGAKSLEEARTLKHYALYLRDHDLPGEAESRLRQSLSIEKQTYESRTDSVTGLHYLDAKELVYTSTLLAQLLFAGNDIAGAKAVLDGAWRVVEKERLFEEAEFCNLYIRVLHANNTIDQELAFKKTLRENRINLERTRDAYISRLLNVPLEVQNRAASSYLVEYYETMAIDLNHSGRPEEAETYIARKNEVAAASGSLAGLNRSNVDFVAAEKALMQTWKHRYDRALHEYDSCIGRLNREGMSSEHKCVDCLYLLPLYQAKAQLLELLGRREESTAVRAQVGKINEFFGRLQNRVVRTPTNLAVGDAVMAFDGRLWRCASVVSREPNKLRIQFNDRADAQEVHLPIENVRVPAPYGVAPCAEF